MGLLLDTHTFIWYYTGNQALSSNALNQIREAKGNFQISIATFWEITIKHGLGKLDFPEDLDDFFKDVLEQGYRILPINFSHLSLYKTLPFHHRDPFDRLIISQGLTEGLDIVSKDSRFDDYLSNSGIKRLW